jgi:hypothetical protein
VNNILELALIDNGSPPATFELILIAVLVSLLAGPIAYLYGRWHRDDD